MLFHEVVAMARNVVQFQKGLSEPAFEQQYGTEEQCRAVVIASRWPHGFECPVCGGRQYSLVTTRDLYQCTKCRRQTSPIAGTIFASTHLPLRVWLNGPGAPTPSPATSASWVMPITSCRRASGRMSLCT